MTISGSGVVIHCQEARLAVRLMGCLLDKGVPLSSLGVISEVRTLYLESTGPRRYLSEMLGRDGQRKMFGVVLRGSFIMGDGDNGDQSLFDHLSEIEPGKWPYAINELTDTGLKALRYI